MNRLQEVLDRVRGELPAGARPEEIALALLDELITRHPGELASALLPLLAPWVHARSRAEIRETERRAWAPRTGAEEDYANPAEEEMRALLREKCYVPGQGMVPWGGLTLEHHRARISFLTRQKEKFTTGINATIRQHVKAADLLGETGCTSLDDYTLAFGSLPAAFTEQESMKTA